MTQQIMEIRLAALLQTESDCVAARDYNGAQKAADEIARIKATNDYITPSVPPSARAGSHVQTAPPSPGDSPSAASSHPPLSPRRSSFRESMKNTLYQSKSFLGMSTQQQLATVLKAPEKSLDCVKLAALIEAGWEKRRKNERDQSDEALNKRCVPEEELQLARARLDYTLGKRQAAAERVAATVNPQMAAQDYPTLLAAINDAMEVGVTQPQHQLATGEKGATFVASSAAWLHKVRETRSAAESHLRTGLAAAARDLDVLALRTHGIDAAKTSGAATAEMILSAEEKVLSVLNARRAAAESLHEVTATTMAGQDTAALRIAIGTAEAAGLSHATHIEAGEPGAVLVKSSIAWLDSVEAARQAAAQIVCRGLEALSADLDTDEFQSGGIEGARTAGGVDPSLIDEATKRLATVLDARSNAATALSSAMAATMAAQDTLALQAAIARAEEAGVAHPTYRLPSAETGAERLRVATAWCRSVLDARASAERILMEAVGTSDVSKIDLTSLRVHGLDAAAEAGGIDGALTARAQARFEDVERRRREAVARLHTLREAGILEGSNLLEQDTTELKEAIDEAQAVGTAHATYELPSGERGSTFVASFVTRLQRVQAEKKQSAALATEEIGATVDRLTAIEMAALTSRDYGLAERAKTRLEELAVHKVALTTPNHTRLELSAVTLALQQTKEEFSADFAALSLPPKASGTPRVQESAPAASAPQSRTAPQANFSQIQEILLVQPGEYDEAGQGCYYHGYGYHAGILDPAIISTPKALQACCLCPFCFHRQASWSVGVIANMTQGRTGCDNNIANAFCCATCFPVVVVSINPIVLAVGVGMGLIAGTCIAAVSLENAVNYTFGIGNAAQFYSFEQVPKRVLVRKGLCGCADEAAATKVAILTNTREGVLREGVSHSGMTLCCFNVADLCICMLCPVCRLAQLVHEVEMRERLLREGHPFVGPIKRSKQAAIGGPPLSQVIIR